MLTNLTTDLNNLNISIIPPITNQPNHLDIVMNNNNNNHILILYILLTISSVIMIFTIILKIKHYLCLDRNLENKVVTNY